MPTFKIRVSTAPYSKAQYRDILRALKRAHVKVVSQGTDSITVAAKGGDCAGAFWNVGTELNRKGLKAMQSFWLRHARLGTRAGYSCTRFAPRKR
jgi:hypothetical protein